METDPSYIIRDQAQLAELYPPALERSVRKQMDHLDDHSRAFIAASPMMILATHSGTSADNSPRGDMPGFVKVADDYTLLIPDRRGNNRLDSLRNLVSNPAVGLLFWSPALARPSA
jgi:predicted pyridoxine 5'-phosphate oxidase superfamily flavin-nucleotide-binding protein